MDKYSDRRAAGQFLATNLKEYANRSDIVVLALPRGGVPVAFEVAKTLKAPLDVFVVRKLGVPSHEELAMGALATGGTVFLNREVIRDLNISQESIDDVITKETNELTRRETKYRGNKSFLELKNKIIILVDDGIATGATMHVAIIALRQFNPAQLVVAVPVAALDTSQALTKIVDRFICPIQSSSFYAVGQWYDDFSQTEDKEVEDLLKEAEKWRKST